MLWRVYVGLCWASTYSIVGCVVYGTHLNNRTFSRIVRGDSNSIDMETLRDIFIEMGASASEERAVRELVSSGRFGMRWTREQWHNRMQGRTLVTDADRIALRIMLRRVRQERLPLEANDNTTILHSQEEFITFINNSDIALRIANRRIYNDDGELVAVLIP